jgi:uncharacterized protein (TIGR03083 family)
MADAAVWIKALRSSHDRFTSLVSSLDEETVQAPSYADEWSIAQVASHLGSQAEIFGMFLDAGLSGGDGPGVDQFRPIWDRWDSQTPALQVSDSVVANDKFLTRVEGLSESERAGFALPVFGNDVDLAGMLGMRLGEFALHLWDIAVALDPAAEIAADVVDLMIDRLPDMAGRVGKPAGDAQEIVVETVSPERRFVVTTGPEVTIVSGPGTTPAGLRLPAESFVRLVSGRLDAAHTPAELADDAVLARLRPVFPGF